MIVKRHILVLCLILSCIACFATTPMLVFGTSIYSTSFTDDDKNFCKEVNFYPNPVSGVLHFNNLRGIKAIIISDITGEQIEKFNNLETEKIDFETTELIKGMYFITFYDINGNVSTKKLIKK